jgi:hypothetical protein
VGSRKGEIMGAKKVYTCNICQDNIVNPSDLFGVVFSSIKIFSLGGYGSTDGIHICYTCARQLVAHLNNSQIRKLLGIPANNTETEVANG